MRRVQALVFPAWKDVVCKWLAVRGSELPVTKPQAFEGELYRGTLDK